MAVTGHRDGRAHRRAGADDRARRLASAVHRTQRLRGSRRLGRTHGNATVRALATRVVVPALKIDLPIVKGNSATRTATSRCTSATWGSPARAAPRTSTPTPATGMFGPIYQLAIPQRSGEEDARDDRPGLHERRQALPVRDPRSTASTQLDLDTALAATSEELWLQTSEGPKGTPGKTQLRAFLLSVGAADPKDAHPKPKPVVCG